VAEFAALVPGSSLSWPRTNLLKSVYDIARKDYLKVPDLSRRSCGLVGFSSLNLSKTPHGDVAPEGSSTSAYTP